MSKVSDRAKLDVAQAAIGLLAERFPALFVRERWQPHRPLKVGISDDIVALDLMPVEEVRLALWMYVRRTMYRRALATAGARYGLDGEACGEVTAEQAAAAAGAVAGIEAKSAGAFKDGVAAFRQAKAQPAGSSKPATSRECRSAADNGTPSLSAPAGPPRLGLADLKRAAAARKMAAEN
jgi:sRNA-binding protein